MLTDDRPVVDSFVKGGLDAAGTGFIIAVQIVFWVTLTFAILEWSDPSGAGPEVKQDWSIADLPPDMPKRQISLAEAAWGIGIMALTATLLVVQHVRGVEAFVGGDDIRETLDGRVVSFSAPGIPTWMAVAAFGLILFASVTEMVKFAVGNWTLPVTIAEIISAAGFVALPVIAINRWGLVNPEINRIWNDDITEWLIGSQFERTVLLVMVVISVLSIVEAVRGYRAYRRREPETPTPGEEFVFIV